MRILIADDDLTCRVILRKSLEKLGHEVIETVDGDRAWDAYRETSPEVVISDWLMPGRDGLDLCHAIREQEDKAYTYFILLTALNDKDSVLKGLEAGADDYLTKPLDAKELQARLISARRVTALHHELARLNAELFQEGRRDPLTRVGNRRSMQEDLEHMIDQAKRYHRPFALALCDIDYFKGYNDTLGHTAGDTALKVVADALVREGRTGDRVYRYGGEEFVVLLPEQSLDSAVTAVERRRKAVEEVQVRHPASDISDFLTISIGVAVFGPESTLTIDALLESADKALYQAKSDSRNCVCVARG